MTTKKLKEIENRLRMILCLPYDFCGMKIRLNYAERAKHPKNWKVDTHYHPWFEFNYVSSGSVYTTINNREFLICAGQSYIIPPGVPHSHRHNGTGDDGICIRFGIDDGNGGEIVKVLSRPHTAPFYSGIEKIGLNGGIYALKAEFAAFLMHIFDKLGDSSDELPTPHNSFSAQIILYLEEYYSQKINTADIAKALNTSYRTLARNFKAETGMTISRKLAEIRLEKAKQLLLSTTLSIHDIALKTGYENEFYFSKVFKEFANVSPKLYRRDNAV